MSMKTTITVQQAQALVDQALPGGGLPDDLMHATPSEVWAKARALVMAILTNHEFEFEKDIDIEAEKFAEIFGPLFQEIDGDLQEVVDMVVQDTVANCGSETPESTINNGGYEEQLLYLATALGGVEKAIKALTDYDQDGKKISFPKDYDQAAVSFNGVTAIWVWDTPVIVSPVD